MTKKHFLLHKINAWLLGNQHCYFVLHYFYLSCVNFSSWTVVLLPDHLSGGLQFQCPASTLGLVWFKQTGSGLCEAIQTTIIVEGPISQVFLPPYFFFLHFEGNRSIFKYNDMMHHVIFVITRHTF